MCKKFFIVLLLFCFSLSCFGQDVSYVITESELNQIRIECENLRTQIKSLNDSQSSDSLLLESLTQRLKDLEQKESDAQRLLMESALQLEALSESLKQSKKEALWLTVKVGVISLGTGAVIGIVAALLID